MTLKETGTVPALMQVTVMRDMRGVARMETRVSVYKIIKKSTILKKKKLPSFMSTLRKGEVTISKSCS